MIDINKYNIPIPLLSGYITSKFVFLKPKSFKSSMRRIIASFIPVILGATVGVLSESFDRFAKFITTMGSTLTAAYFAYYIRNDILSFTEYEKTFLGNQTDLKIKMISSVAMNFFSAMYCASKAASLYATGYIRLRKLLYMQQVM